jgi:hypothetical protein
MDAKKLDIGARVPDATRMERTPRDWRNRMATPAEKHQ